MELHILNFKGSQVEISKLYHKDFFTSANSASADHDGKSHFILVFTVCQSTCLQASTMKRVNEAKSDQKTTAQTLN